ncbi:MAG TPA: glycosyltransferase family 4 protein [Fimbriimonadaceae bacterium]|nr:glycosyltransferase family 4 protein [Fimbriimonadaceae bacterium]
MPLTLPKTVVMVNDNAFVQGGAAKVAIGEALLLADLGIKVHFFAASGPPDPRLASHPNIETHCIRGEYDIRQVGGLTLATRGLWDVFARREMARLLDRFDPTTTLVHVHMVREQLSASVYRPILDADFPIVVTLHEYNIGCPYGGFFDYTAGAICKRKGLSTECLLARCNNGSYGRKLWFFAKGKMQQTKAGVPGRIADWICISEKSRSVLEPYLPTGAEVHFVDNPVEAVDLGMREFKPGSPFLFLGRLTVEKDPVTFAKAAYLLKTPAVFVGDGPLTDDVRKANPDAVLTGWLPKEQVVEHLRGARALVFPSVWYETLGLTVQEAAASGVATITSDVCVPADLVIPGVTGSIFKAGDVDDLASKMTDFLSDQEAARMGHNAYEKYWDNPLTPERHRDRLVEVYGRILSKRGPSG